MDKRMSKNRSGQVLKLLSEHGPMSYYAIQTCISPVIEKRRLHEVLERLKKYALIERKVFPAVENRSHFYKINTAPRALAAISEVLEVPIQNIKQPYFRRVELIHSNSCALWKEYFKRRYPEALVLRDFEISQNQFACETLLADEDIGSLPDIFIKMPTLCGSSSLSLAIEIERNVKSSKRWLRKLLKYARESKLNGVLYFTEGNMSFSRLFDVYFSEVLNRALRIQHYGDHFLMLSNDVFIGFDTSPRLINSKGSVQQLEEWIDTLRSVPNGQIRNAMFSRYQHQGAAKF